MVARTSTEYAPWTLVAAEDKRFARLQVLETACEAAAQAIGDFCQGRMVRRWFVESDFGAFGLEGVDLGGDFFGLVIGAAF